MFVVGASRVRDMFEQAKKAAPWIIFIDEIDAVGRQRGAGLGGRWTNTEPNATEMDGSKVMKVLSLSATNRPDVLDQHYFVQVVWPSAVIGLPMYGRYPKSICRTFITRCWSRDFSAVHLASGADLVNLVNEKRLYPLHVVINVLSNGRICWIR